MNLDGIDVFVRVVQAGSFTGAAKAMGMPVTTVSGKVAQLEKRLGVTLLRRTTRKLSVTQAGEGFFRRCLKALEEVDAAEKELATNLKEPEGTLKITVAVDVGQTILPTLIQGYLKQYPKMRVEMVLTNRLVDLVGEGMDLGLRIGSLKDSSMIARKWFDSEAGLWATPAYLKKMGTPQKISDLSRHDCFHYAPSNLKLKLTNGKDKVEANLRSRVTADDMGALKALTLQGEGIGLLPDFLCVSEARAGKLIRILPQWQWASFSLSFVYPAQRFVPPKVQTFISWASEQIQKKESPKK